MEIVYKKFFDKNILKILKNASVLLSGSLGANVLGVLTLVVVARELGASDLGVLTLIQTYTLLLISIFLPKPWIVTVKYGTKFINKLQFNQMKGLIKYGFLLEIFTAITSFILVNLIIYLFFSNLEFSFYLSIYSIVILFSISGVSLGILRLYEQFKLLSSIEFGVALLKLFVIIATSVLNPTFLNFLLAYMFGEILKHLLYVISSVYFIKKEGYFKIRAEKLGTILDENKGIVNFLISTHFNDVLGTIRRNLDVVIIGLLLSSQAVGLLRVIKQFGKVFSLLGNPIKKTIYPEFCKLWEEERFKHYHNFIRKITLMMLIFISTSILLVSPFMDQIISLLFSSEFIVVSTPLLFYLISHGIFLSFQTLNSALLSMGKANIVLLIELFTNIVYFLCLFLFTIKYELYGVVLSFFISILFWIIISYYYFNKYYRKTLTYKRRAI